LICAWNTEGGTS